MSEPTARQIAERFYTHLPAYRRDSLAEAIEQRVATLTADLAQARQERDAERVKRIVAEQSRTLSLLGRSSEQELREDNLRIALAEAQVSLTEALQARDAALLQAADLRVSCHLRPLEAARTALLEAAEIAEKAGGRTCGACRAAIADKIIARVSEMSS